MNLTLGYSRSSGRSSETIRVLVHFNSWTVGMEVEFRKGVCDNTLVECTSVTTVNIAVPC